MRNRDVVRELKELTVTVTGIEENGILAALELTNDALRQKVIALLKSTKITHLDVQDWQKLKGRPTLEVAIQEGVITGTNPEVFVYTVRLQLILDVTIEFPDLVETRGAVWQVEWLGTSFLSQARNNVENRVENLILGMLAYDRQQS